MAAGIAGGLVVCGAMIGAGVALIVLATLMRR